MKNLYLKLAKFQQNCPKISKDAQGYGYKYADLPKVIETINPLLKECGLGFTQLVGSENNQISVETIIFEIETGEELKCKISSDIPDFKGMTKIQCLGSIITYLRRYSLSSILGIVSDEDNDGNIKQQPENKPENKKPETIWLSKENFEKLLDIISSKDLITANKLVTKYTTPPYAIKKEYKEIILSEIEKIK